MTVAKDFGIKVVERPVEKKELFELMNCSLLEPRRKSRQSARWTRKQLEAETRAANQEASRKFLQIVKGEDKKYENGLVT